MANKKGFDLAAVLGSVSDLNTTEQIVRLPLDLIDPDPDNFYSLEGLDELAGNIELVGLLDPIRVRPNGERYTIVSGHRRRAAIMLIRDGGSKQFEGGVPCIVEYGEASDAMRKLRLIYANASTRQLSSAEQSKQAEEVARLLYELKEQGVEFPGRMRDHVAQACGSTKSKIARLHAIRENAWEDILKAFDTGEINESVAYTFSKLPRTTQRRIWVNHLKLGYKVSALTADYVDKLAALYQKLCLCKCKKSNIGCGCVYAESRFDYAQRLTHFEGVRANCFRGRCCINCSEIAECEYACVKCEEERAQVIADRERRKKERELDLERQKNAAERTRRDHDEECADIWERIRRAAEENGRNLEGVFDQVFDNDGSIELALRWCAGEEKDSEHFAIGFLDDCLIDMADLLGCSCDFLLGRTEIVCPAGVKDGGQKPARDLEAATYFRPDGHLSIDGIYTALCWQTGQPLDDGRYLCLVDINAGKLHEQRCEYKDGKWLAYGQPIHELFTVKAWWPLPPEMYWLPHEAPEDDDEEDEA